jgi:hypothetical protein
MAGLAAFSNPVRVSKKGFGIALKENADWRDKLRELNAGWFYTWGAQQPADIPAGVEYVPMIWGPWSCTDSTMKRLVSEKHKILLGFNEPGHKRQANMTVETAVELWPKLMDTGMRLGSPAAVNADGEWMSAFMNEVDRRGYRVDFIAVHSYMGKDANHFLRRLDKIHKMYRRPIWITEFAVADWEARKDKPNRYIPDDVYAFMETVLPALEETDYIERYAWFSAPMPSLPLAPSVLFNPDGSLTRLGRLYAGR